MSCRLGMTLEYAGETLSADGSCVVRYRGEFFILCVLSGIDPEELFKEEFFALTLPDSDLLYLGLDYVIDWHRQKLAATGGKLGDRAHLAKMTALREALRDGRESFREVAG